MTLTDAAESPPRQSTFAQWVAALLRAYATRLDGGTIAPLTPAEIAREKLRDAEIALMAAHTEKERWNHTVAMLTERVARLQGVR